MITINIKYIILNNKIPIITDMVITINIVNTTPNDNLIKYNFDKYYSLYNIGNIIFGICYDNIVNSYQ
jgi:hypothetical protein